jgi:primosomal protein N' (replication factor Y) (superfamily II helicase)
METVAEVALATSVGENSLYHYQVPAELADGVGVGTLVHVPFGPRELQGVVFEPDAQPIQARPLKPIRAVLDPVPVVTPAGIALARWVSAYYSCPVAEVLAAMLPPGLARHTVYEIERVDGAPTRHLTPRERVVLELVPAQGTIALERLTREGGKTAAGTVAGLVKRGVLRRHARLSVAAGPKTVRLAEWTGKEPEGRLGPKSGATLAVLKRAEGPMVLAELGRHVDGAGATLAGLQRRGLVRICEEVMRRDPISHRPLTPSAPPPLTAEQEGAVGAITTALHARRPATFLVHGVTGSGKTEVYLQALAAAIALGRQGIVLVPEISLTPQTMDRFAARFPGRVALLHSRLSEGERLDEWERARTGAVDAVVGARSAIFSPLPDPGLIVLDEEHDASYKQDRTPRYHAREVAIRLARETGAVVVLGSATPDVTSYYRALHGTYRLLEMTQRPTPAHPQPPAPSPLEGEGAPGASIALRAIAAAAAERAPSPPIPLPPTGGGVAIVGSAIGAPGLPPVEVVDLRQELQAGNRSIFSRALQAAVREALRRQEQVILFLNRRGSATFVICRDCGFVVRCPYCDLPYTYHSATAELICHRCDDRARPPELCRRCGSWRIRYFGLGTQRVEEEAGRHFPGARLLRWDRDVGGGRHGHEQVLDRFARGGADILVGTQMVAKGLDIPRVTVVGVVSADTTLNLPDFRSSERAFQVLTQVAGRAGRHVLPGRVVVQTYAPDHFAILAAAQHDYTTFYEQELVFRAEAAYPPFTQLLRLVYNDASDETCRAAAEGLAAQLRGALALVRHGEVIGPAPCFIGKIAGRYLWQVLVRADDVHPLLPLIPPGWTRDVDPMSLL